MTHDVGETASFDRVLVVSSGRVVESGAPAELAAQAGSRYRAILDAETTLRQRLWAESLLADPATGGRQDRTRAQSVASDTGMTSQTQRGGRSRKLQVGE